MALAARSSHQAALSSRRSKKLNMIKDDGLDSNGIYRNIARDQVWVLHLCVENYKSAVKDGNTAD